MLLASIPTSSGQSNSQQSTMPPGSSASPSSSNTGSCHLRELDLCAASLLVFLQAPSGLATTEQEINKQCLHIKEADNCMANYTRRCMTPIQRQMTNMATNSTIQLGTDYCTKGSNFRNTYLKHVTCINQVQKREQKGCMRDLQAALELLSSGFGSLENGKRLSLGCCAYKRFESCFGDQLEKRCGKDTVGFVQTTMRRAISRIPETVCRPYRADTSECRSLLPKIGTIPKGSKSNSIISRLMSAYSGI